MRRIHIFGIALGVLLLGGGVDLILQAIGIESDKAGIWAQAVLFVGLMGWLATYLLRVGNGNMTYHQQVKAYEDQVLQKRLDELSPEELAKLQAEIEQEQSVLLSPTPPP